MRNEFVPYMESLALKELGFNEPCLAGYNFKDGRTGDFNYPSAKDANTTSNPRVYHNDKQIIGAPLFSQAFRWFREKHGLVFNLVGSGPYYPSIALTYMDGDSDIELYEFDTYEEAELVCLKKLIEIVKQKNMSKIPTAEEYAHLEYLKEDMLDMGLKNMDDLLNKQKKKQ